MASKKMTGTNQHRNKEGILEFKKKSWKSYSFKVSASTYLLYFKTDLSKPEGMLLLANVTEVHHFPSKGASFPFEVVFRGKGSPWKLNASSNEERISWMEAILPGSSKSLTTSLKDTHSPSPSRNYSNDFPPPYQSNNSNDSRTPSRDDHTPSHTLAEPNTYASTRPTRPSYPGCDSDEDTDFLAASLPPPVTNPQEYLMPELWGPGKNHSPPKRGMSAGDVSALKLKPSPRPRRRRTSPHVSPKVTPRREPSETNGHGEPDDSDYVTMMSSPVRRQSTASNGEEPDYLKVIGSDSECYLDEHNYVLPESIPEDSLGPLVPERRRATSEQSRSDSIQSTGSTYSRGAESGGAQEGASNLVDTISRHFNPQQIGLLIQMLQDVRVDKKQSEEDVARAWQVGSPPVSPSSPIVYGEQDSITLRGNLKRALSYVPTLTEGILVTEDDSDASYEVRPGWAKAVNATPAPQASTQPDTLSDLQHEALYLAKADIGDLQVIGQGQFGEVFKGVLRRGSESTPVAVKMTKKTISDYLQQSFLKEMRIMSEMVHPNIVRLYGLVTEDVPSPWIVLEYMEHGDLKTFLTKNERPIQQLVKYMVDVAMGMHYISERGLVHRDLAARNVLVGTNEICKVADFGLLREIPRDDSIYISQHNVPCPIRWMPPESISDRVFSPASDVWSFGVLVWEMFNPTKLPFEKYDNLACATKVNEGLRMPIPRGTPSVVAKIMKACWHKNPNKRPSFLLISTLLSTRTTF